MSNIYSKSKTILEAVRNIFISDIVNTNHEVRELRHYIGGRVFRIMTKGDKLFPQIVTEIEDSFTNPNMPTGEYILILTIFVNIDSPMPKDKIDLIAARVFFLINKKEGDLNDQIPSKNLRCRSCVHQVSFDNNDYTPQGLYGKEVRYFLKCDDEIISDR